ncbi:hypothetical protein [Sporosarcina phage Lietuvens]|nr:hypothetical protein [Sporosarcina phage Lietuvens]
MKFIVIAFVWTFLYFVIFPALGYSPTLVEAILLGALLGLITNLIYN